MHNFRVKIYDKEHARACLVVEVLPVHTSTSCSFSALQPIRKNYFCCLLCIERQRTPGQPPRCVLSDSQQSFSSRTNTAILHQDNSCIDRLYCKGAFSAHSSSTRVSRPTATYSLASDCWLISRQCGTTVWEYKTSRLATVPRRRRQTCGCGKTATFLTGVTSCNGSRGHKAGGYSHCRTPISTAISGQRVVPGSYYAVN